MKLKPGLGDFMPSGQEMIRCILQLMSLHGAHHSIVYTAYMKSQLSVITPDKLLPIDITFSYN